MVAIGGLTEPDHFCPLREQGAHMEHDFIGAEGEDRSCKGAYVLLADFDQWIVTQHPTDPSKGWLESTYTYYPIDSSRLHEADWEDHVTAKTWVNGVQFRAALREARRIFGVTVRG